MFISAKRHEREKQDLIGASNRLTDAILKSSAQGLFLLDAMDKVLPQVSTSLGTLFRREDFTNLSFEKLIGPLVTAKTSDPRLQHRNSCPLPFGLARNWPSTLPTWVPVTTITCTPAAHIASMRSRTLEASA